MGIHSSPIVKCFMAYRSEKKMGWTYVSIALCHEPVFLDSIHGSCSVIWFLKSYV